MKNENEHNPLDSERPTDASAHERLCAYLFGELNAADAAGVEAELAASEDLRQEHARLSATIGLLRTTASADESLSPELLATIERAVQPLPRIQAWYTRTPLRAAAGVAALLTGLIGGRVLMQAGPPVVEYAAQEDLATLDEFEEADAKLDDQVVESFSAVTSELASAEAEKSGMERFAKQAKLEAGIAESAKRGETRTNALELSARDAATASLSEPSSVDKTLGTAENTSSNFEGGYKGPSDGVPPGGAPNTTLESSVVIGGELKNMETFGLTQELSARSVSISKSAQAPQDQPIQLDGLNLLLYDANSRQLEVTLDAGKAGLPVTATDSKELVSLGYLGEASKSSALESKMPQFESTRTRSKHVNPPAEAASSGPTTPGPVDRQSDLGLQLEKVQLGREAGDRLIDDLRASTALSPEQLEALCDERTTQILTSCRRRPNEQPADMFFRFWGDNAFELSQLDHQSTFGVDVDTASYTLARRYLLEGNLPGKAQIRTEEFVNYFKPDIAAPSEGVFAIRTELAPSRFGNAADATSQRWMMRVGVRGREVAREERKPLSLTFVIDTSGSMKEGGRLELVKHAIRLLSTQLDGADSLSIVGFSKSARIVLPMTSAQNRGLVEEALYGLIADGGTNAEAGLLMGYEVAASSLSTQAHSRVVLLSDGVANIGQVDQDRINATVQGRRASGIYLNTIGVGMSNHNDTFLEQLANKGDGICNYVDSPIEARRALVENFTGAFEPIARDVKIQVEFDPSQVYRYRLLGYENRAIADADFRNDAVDAGEVGAGHQVVALYELELTGTQSSEPMATVRLRWKDPSGAERDPREDQSTEIAHTMKFSEATDWGGASLGYRRSVLVAQFAEILRRSVHAREDSLDDLTRETVELSRLMPDSDLVEFLALLQRSHELIVNQAPSYGDLSRCVDEIRRNRILQAQLEELRRTENVAVLEELRRSNDELEQRIRDLIRRELEQKVR